MPPFHAGFPDISVLADQQGQVLHPGGHGTFMCLHGGRPDPVAAACPSALQACGDVDWKAGLQHACATQQPDQVG